MWVECLTIRVGHTIVDFKDFRYTFQPPVGAQDDEWTTSVANIIDDATLKYFLGDKEKGTPGRANFRPYDRARTEREMMERRKAKAAQDKKFQGYSLEKLELAGQDRGYMIVDYRGDSVKFMGAEGRWSGSISEISGAPFGHLRQAEEYLMKFVKGLPLPEFVAKKEYPCKECEESFDDPGGLFEHWKAAHQKAEAKAPSTEEEASGPKKKYKTPADQAA
jgi:hypothetical protein